MHFPSLDQLRERGTQKWTHHPDDVLPLWIAESDFGTCPEVKQAIADAVQREAFGYPPEPSALRSAMVSFYRSRYAVNLNPDGIFAIPDVVRGLELAITHFTRPGSPVIIPVPCYPPFLDLPLITDREALYVSAEGGLDADEIEQAFAAGAGSLLLCSPNNPLGYTFDADFLRVLADIAARHGGRIIVDEIHSHLVYDRLHTMAATVSETAAATCITVTAASKAWNVAGLKCAQLIFTNPDDITIWYGLNHLLRGGYSTLGLVASEACYLADQSFLTKELEYLRSNRDWLADELPARIPGLRTTVPEATYLMWLDFRDTAVPGEPAPWLLKHAGVALNDGTTFGPGGSGHARLNFASSRATLTEAVNRMADACAQA
ncbi:aminotransferase class I/II-fold pyridoxal phosphate-dependent enzyme [Corynebacterium sp. CCM 9185]|uniref:cysteine-S-conjugate beta-lyase n=1 Tax=Corynebacterium marambiense TaxID=2765364 RepID=A0ABS0VW49_9CORY|nr:aminotransferase class I/II-fold pyridoxal phosphate-dependent enzyme [Corynebacterium marambiense]MBI9001003.1 aminotransferase class I/II-fold pyridoxal phosphate-dependent enzyme [Corynebacterium marambiense]MCK7662726.1 aminotransferase class I/II-fold pyridoxal phosphate-dependent enzyme [Corynebacterium marambiense]MCX7543236.1 aminotransferase class I/II-fold pyridoxal phosphate-dependent enzyme [Corynebacterium marambiense]